MPSKKKINEAKNKKTKKDKTKMENVGRPAAYSFTKFAPHAMKVVLCNPLPLQNV